VEPRQHAEPPAVPWHHCHAERGAPARQRADSQAHYCWRRRVADADGAGALFLRTGLHSGKVGFTVELHDSRPPVDESWEQVVEASFRRDAASQVMLVTWGGHLAGRIAR
jgi:hypothetical protein